MIPQAETAENFMEKCQYGKAIDEFNAGRHDVTLLKGIEVDILEDGSLDLPDEVLKDLDLFKTVGELKPLVKEYQGVPVENGQLVIGFTPNIENPQICGIEVLAE